MTEQLLSHRTHLDLDQMMTTSSDPRAFHCPVCRAEPGEPCRSKQPAKVAHSHQPRQDRMIRASWRSA